MVWMITTWRWWCIVILALVIGWHATRGYRGLFPIVIRRRMLSRITAPVVVWGIGRIPMVVSVGRWRWVRGRICWIWTDT
jgi:hypothetical protein